MLILNEIINHYKIKKQNLLHNLNEYLKKINNNKLTINIISDLIIKINNKKIKISDISNVVLFKFDTLKLEVFDKNHIPLIKKSVFQFDNSINIILKKNEILLEFKNLFLDNKEEKNKKINKEIELFKLNSRILRKKILSENKNSFSKDDFLKLKKEIEKIDNLMLSKIDK